MEQERGFGFINAVIWALNLLAIAAVGGGVILAGMGADPSSNHYGSSPDPKAIFLPLVAGGVLGILFAAGAQLLELLLSMERSLRLIQNSTMKPEPAVGASRNPTDPIRYSEGRFTQTPEGEFAAPFSTREEADHAAKTAPPPEAQSEALPEAIHTRLVKYSDLKAKAEYLAWRNDGFRTVEELEAWRVKHPSTEPKE